MDYSDYQRAFTEAVQAHQRATAAYEDLAARLLARRSGWVEMTRACGWCGTHHHVVLVQGTVPSTTHGICDCCLAVEMAKIQHPTTGRG
jgi:hypothetical protein